ncbi:hypothetical protein DSL72_004139 [Monilinia vaccinii-corymbosi]|uniref:Uncharacterized protein n=1 Tax=Monilinia vaccinii-corymbosi TaxID=61207 RepID=A0A8A3NVU7_9HELO|nr:hypothetical protein DSL72_004139 [Monilinia vaccinii-corymbosi]
MKITHTTYNEVRGGAPTPMPPQYPKPEFITTPTAFGFGPAPTPASAPPQGSNPLRSTARKITRYLKRHVRFHGLRRPRPGSQNPSRSRYGTSVTYPPGELHPPDVPTQVGKYHSGSVRGSASSRGGGGGEERVLVVGSQAHERGLEQRYKHVRGKKRPSYLNPREDVGGGGSGGEYGFEHQGVRGLDLETYMKQRQGLERDFGKGYQGGNSPPNPESGGMLRNDSPPRNISPPTQHSLAAPRKDAGDGQWTRDGKGMTPMAFDGNVKQQRGLERDFVKAYGYGGSSPSPLPIRSPGPAEVSSDAGTGAGNASLGDNSVRFSDVQWSSVGSADSGTGTTETMESGTRGDSSRGRGVDGGKQKVAPEQRGLRRKHHFEGRDQSPATTPASSRAQTVGKEDANEMGEDLQRERPVEDDASGDVGWEIGEEVVPPSQHVPKHTEILRPSNPPSTSSQNSGNSKTQGKGKMIEGRASPLQKLKGYIGHGAEVVDDFVDKKTNLKTVSKLPSPFEYLLYPSYDGKGKGKGKGERSSAEKRARLKGKGKGKEGEGDGEDSDEELWGCVGEQNNESTILPAAHAGEKVKNRAMVQGGEPQKTRQERDLHHSGNLCKLCLRHERNGPNVLCRTCEENFLHTKAWEETSEDFGDDDDIPPTPPPKDPHITSMREILATAPPNYGRESDYRPPPSAKDSVSVSKVENRRPELMNPSPVRQESQMLIYGGMGDSPRDIEIGFPEWQTHALEFEGAKTEQLFKRWSENYRGEDLRSEAEQGGEYEYDEEGKEQEQSPRDETFYDFWEDILKGDERPATPKLEDRKPRTEE